MNLTYKVVLITGASRGLGLALAEGLADKGARLALVARGATELEGRASALGGRADVLALPADVAQDAETIIEKTLERFGRIDVLINNASTIGTSPMPRLDQLEWQELEAVLRVNVLAPFHLTRLALPSLRKNRGTVVNISSDAAVEAYPGWGAYGTSKAALDHLTRILAAESGEDLRVLLVDPGDMRTRMHEQAEPGVDLSGLPLPADVAPRILDLLERNGSAFERVRAQQLVRL